MELFIGIAWPLTVIAALIIGYKLRKPIEKVQDELKASATKLANQEAAKATEVVKEVEKVT